MTTSLRPYRTSDFDSLWALWQSTLGESWPLTREFLRRITSDVMRYHEGDNIVAEQDSHVVGFVATRVHSAGKGGGVPLLIVSPEKQRQGIGTLLHNAAFEQLRQKQVETINFTDGGEPFWPGVPLNVPGAVDFFKSCGWNFSHTSYDLTRDLIDYQTPADVLERAAKQGITIRLASWDEAISIVDFEQCNFPFWSEYFEKTAQAGRYSDILAAWDGAEVVGSLLINRADVTGLNPDALWHTILGDDMGGIGAVGVNEQRQGCGIGLALVATASNILQARGLHQCIIGWTDLMDFYGKLGYTIWRGYAMADLR